MVGNQNQSLVSRSSSMALLRRGVDRNTLKDRREDFLRRTEGLARERVEQRAKAFELPKLGVEHQLFFVQPGRPVEQKPPSEL